MVYPKKNDFAPSDALNSFPLDKIPFIKEAKYFYRVDPCSLFQVYPIHFNNYFAPSNFQQSLFLYLCGRLCALMQTRYIKCVFLLYAYTHIIYEWNSNCTYISLAYPAYSVQIHAKAAQLYRKCIVTCIIMSLLGHKGELKLGVILCFWGYLDFSKGLKVYTQLIQIVGFKIALPHQKTNRWEILKRNNNNFFSSAYSAEIKDSCQWKVAYPNDKQYQYTVKFR